jgi:hypothetical protein
MKNIKIGDVFLIPLSNGRNGYGQYVGKDRMGPLVRIFDLISEGDIDLDELKSKGFMFAPVITGLFAAIKSGQWELIGTLPIKDFECPHFISARYNNKTKKTGMWYLWDGTKSSPIGKTLPEDYTYLEQLIVWEPNNLARRIESGENPYDFMLDSG